MLSLSRRHGESITLILPNGEEILVSVIKGKSSDAVRVGITAPDDVEIIRTELLEEDAEIRP